jgi:hypothetical protein
VRAWAFDPAAASVVATALVHDPDPRVRAAAASALAEAGLVPYAAALEEAARRDPVPDVRRAAAAGHRRLSGLGKSPRRAAGYSLLCPGCGYFHLGETGTGLAFLGATALALGTGVGLAVSSLRGGAGVASDSPFRDARGPIGRQLFMAGQNLWMYSVFAAYRDARALRDDAGYTLPGTRESLADLAVAPFRPRVLARPWFWAGLPLLFGAALGVTALLEDDFPGEGGRWLREGRRVRVLGAERNAGAAFALGELYYAGLFWPVGIGEEALFRGVVQPGLSESFGPWGGWATSSLLFGAAHIPNYTRVPSATTGLIGVPFVTLVGSYLGLVSMQTGYQLETSVALHFWYDFLLGTTAFLADPTHQPFSVRIGWSY